MGRTTSALSNPKPIETDGRLPIIRQPAMLRRAVRVSVGHLEVDRHSSISTNLTGCASNYSSARDSTEVKDASGQARVYDPVVECRSGGK